MSHPQEALLMPATRITQHPSRNACNSARLPVKVRQQQLATLGCLSPFSPSAYHSANTASSRQYCWLYFVLCWVLQSATQISIDNARWAVMRAHTTALGHASQLLALQKMKDAKQHSFFFSQRIWYLRRYLLENHSVSGSNMSPPKAQHVRLPIGDFFHIF